VSSVYFYLVFASVRYNIHVVLITLTYSQLPLVAPPRTAPSNTPNLIYGIRKNLNSHNSIMTLAGFKKDGEVDPAHSKHVVEERCSTESLTEADSREKEGAGTQASREKMDDRIEKLDAAWQKKYDEAYILNSSSDEQLHATIARLQADVASEREKVKKAEGELAEESKRLRRCERKLRAREEGSNVWLDELEQKDEEVERKDEEMEELRHEVKYYKEEHSRAVMELAVLRDKVRRGESLI